MALPVERLTAEQLAADKADRRRKAERLPSKTPGQGFLRDQALAWTEVREVAEELLLADRAALAAEDPDTMRVVAAKRRLVELSIRCATKVRLACMEGVDFAGKMFVTTQVDAEGLTEEELKMFKVLFMKDFL
jgi:hypothetical protein